MRENPAVPFLRLIGVEEATGDLKLEYEAAVQRAGKVFNIVKAMSLAPAVLRRSIALYSEIMHGPSELSRADRELLATVVSSANDINRVAEAVGVEDEPEWAREEQAHAGTRDFPLWEPVWEADTPPS